MSSHNADSLLLRVAKTIREEELIPANAKVLCAVSGGADSICLLHILWRLRSVLGFQLTAAHYNHHLRGEESNRDERFVQTFLREYCPDVALMVGSGDVHAAAAERKRGLEDAARVLRYAFLEETADAVQAERIATAHHAGDNVETVLLHLLRGTGLHGLTGISPKRGRLIRPVLSVRQEEMREYLRFYHLPHVEDSTNTSSAFARNRVRHELLPLMEELSPGFSERLSAALPSLRAEDGYLQQAAARIAGSAERTEDGIVIDAHTVAKAGFALAPRVVRELLAMARDGDDPDSATYSAAHLRSVTALCMGQNPSASVVLPHGLSARREYDKLILSIASSPPSLVSLPLDFQGVTLPENSLWACLCMACKCPPPHQRVADVWYLRTDALSPDALLRPRQTGDRLTLPGRGVRSVKKLLIDAKIPRRQREQIPVLADAKGVAGVAGFGCEEARLARPGEDAWCVTFLKRRKDGT